MAASKKKTAVAKRGNTTPANIQQQLQTEVAGIQDQIGAPASNAISIRDKVFTLPDGSVINSAMEVVILDFISRNNFYESKWDPKNPQPPACFAISKVVKTLAPSPNSPHMQVSPGQTCEECPMNQFGSDGDGKACKNTRLLAVLPVDAADDDPIMTLSVPPTAVRAFDGYVGQVAKLFGTPPIGVVTTIDFHPDKSFPMPIFGHPEPNPNLEAHFARRPEADVLLTAEPDTSALDSTSSSSKKKTSKKKTSKR